MKKKFEFSKVVVGLLLSTYFIVLAIGIYMSIKLIATDSMSATNCLGAVLSYVGVVNSISVPFYLHKSEKENLNKYPNVQTIEDYKTFNSIQQNDAENDATTNNETDTDTNENNSEEVNK